jgi:hypothetical protein
VYDCVSSVVVLEKLEQCEEGARSWARLFLVSEEKGNLLKRRYRASMEHIGGHLDVFIFLVKCVKY